MMEFNWRYRNALTSIFLDNRSTSIENINAGVIPNIHDVFNRLFVVDISLDNIEVPLFAKEAVESVITRNIRQGKHLDKVVIPLYTNSVSQARRTADAITKDFFTRISFNQRLQKVTTNKGEVYYGGRGIILDKDFNILFLCSLSYKRGIHEGQQVVYMCKPIIHVSPKVFLEGNGIMEKTILKKIIPFYLTCEQDLRRSRYFNYDANDSDSKSQIVIDDANKFMEVPIKPTPQKCSDEVLNQILIDNVDEVLNQIQYDS